jgi:hypothetical protein
MLAPVKSPEMPFALPAPASDAYTLAELRAVLTPHAGLPLVFEYAGRKVQPGYHVTEVKSGKFSALDCGANPESWREAFIQLWDVPEDRTHMPAGKFLSIIGKVLSEIDLDQDTRLTFEVSDGTRPIELYRALAIDLDDTSVNVTLGNLPASCKPRDRWLEAKIDSSAKGRCEPAAQDEGCCG